MFLLTKYFLGSGINNFLDN